MKLIEKSDENENSAHFLLRALLFVKFQEKQIPACYFPSKSGGYELRQKQLDRNKNAALTLTRLSGRAKNPYGQDLPELNFVTKSIGSTLHLQIGTESRFLILTRIFNLSVYLTLLTHWLQIYAIEEMRFFGLSPFCHFPLLHLYFCCNYNFFL